LDIFKIQSGTTKAAVAEYNLMETPITNPNEIYELKVLIGEQWVKRRMTIGTLGEESSSHSKCYYVLYDTHMVVKIPSNPVTDFQQYLRSIKKEAEIVHELDTIECIIPRISVILKKIHIIPDEEKLSSDALEKKYIKVLSNNAPFQSYLKIGKTFVYFMDLSRYFFLENTINELHDLKEKMVDEIMYYSDIIWDHSNFLWRYGSKAWPVCVKLQEIYNIYETKVLKLLAKHNLYSRLHQYQIRHCFLIHLSGRDVDYTEIDLDEDIVSELNKIYAKEIAKYSTEISAYRGVIKKYIQDTSFSQNKHTMGSIISNALNLVSLLSKKDTSMRDLKPGNLLVVGDPEKYPSFLQTPESYSIGIIDVETAVNYSKFDTGEIEQPMLGGTPLYANLSQVINNEILKLFYPDLPKVFNHQDWHATVAIIYKIITGEALFKETAGLFPSILKVIHRKVPEEKVGMLKNEFSIISKYFWDKALDEFKKAMEKNQEKLESLNVPIPDKMSNNLIYAAQQHKNRLKMNLKELIDQQSFFNKKKDRLNIQSASVKRIDKIKEKWIIKKLDGGGDEWVTSKVIDC